jgi:hypothetical protein
MPAIVGGRIIGRLPLAAIAESRPRGFSGVEANSAPLPAGLTPQRRFRPFAGDAGIIFRLNLEPAPR